MPTWSVTRFPSLLKTLIAVAIVAIPFIVAARDRQTQPSPEIPKIQTVGASVMLRLQREGAPVYDFRKTGQKIPGAIQSGANTNFKVAPEMALIGDEKQMLPLAKRLIQRREGTRVYVVPSAMVAAYPDFSGVRQIEPRALARLMKTRKVRVFDFAEDEEFGWSHVSGSARIAWQDVMRSERNFLPAVQPGETVALICPVGSRSQLAAQKLKRAGVQVLNVRGGMYAWQNAGLPVEGSIMKRSSYVSF